VSDAEPYLTRLTTRLLDGIERLPVEVRERNTTYLLEAQNPDGGFSGRESQVTAAWLADAVDAGQIRWVLTDSSGGGMPTDSRVGSKDVMTAVQNTCKKVSAVSGLYDCQGSTAALRAAS